MGGQTSTITFFFFLCVCGPEDGPITKNNRDEMEEFCPRESFSVGGRYREESLSSPLFSFPVAIVH